MPILLDTPHTYSDGHGTPVETYFHAMILHHSGDTYPVEHISLQVQYGNWDPSAGVWTPGRAPVVDVQICDLPAKIEPVEVAIMAPVFDDDGEPVLDGDGEQEMIDTGRKTRELQEVEAANPIYSTWAENTFPVGAGNFTLRKEMAIAYYSYLLSVEGFSGSIV